MYEINCTEVLLFPLRSLMPIWQIRCEPFVMRGALAALLANHPWATCAPAAIFMNGIFPRDRAMAPTFPLKPVTEALLSSLSLPPGLPTPTLSPTITTDGFIVIPSTAIGGNEKLPELVIVPLMV